MTYYNQNDKQYAPVPYPRPSAPKAPSLASS